MSERQGVEIDYCPQCRGIWLDRGELDKIMERAAQMEYQQSHEMGQQTQSAWLQPQSSYEPQASYRAEPERKKKSWWQEILD